LTISALKVSFLEETLKNCKASAGVRAGFFSANAVLRAISATVKNLGESEWNFFRASPKKARFLRLEIVWVSMYLPT